MLKTFEVEEHFQVHKLESVVRDRHPRLLEDIIEGSHEIATHGYPCELIYHQRPQEFAGDLTGAVDATEAACGVRPVGCRAPGSSIMARPLWAVDVLLDCGILYDVPGHPSPQ